MPFSLQLDQTGRPVADMMDKQEIITFFDRLAPSWDAEPRADRGKINFLLDQAGIVAGSRVLDVACGTGVLFPFYLERQVAAVTAVDISPEMVRIASKKAQDPRIRVICADIEALQPDHQVDCCVIYNAFPHFVEPSQVIGALTQWLVPGGRLTVAHGLSLKELNAHHQGTASRVSRGLLPMPEMQALLGQWLHVDRALSDDAKYLASGTLKPDTARGL